MKKRIQETGFFKTCGFYLAKALSALFGGGMKLWLKIARPACKQVLVFKNRQGQDYSGNCAAFYDYLAAEGYDKTYQLVWLISDRKSRKALPGAKTVLAETKGGWTSPAAFYYSYVARYFFYTNHSAGLNLLHNPDQKTVNLWHGCGYKAGTAENKNIKHIKGATDFDCALVPGSLFVDSKSRFWNCSPDKILPLGYPIYDWLLDSSLKKDEIIRKLGFIREDYIEREEGIAQEMHPEYGLKSGSERRVILWMPTFRNTNGLEGFAENGIRTAFGLPLVEDEDRLRQLNTLCAEENILLLIKKHPLQSVWGDARLSNISFLTDADLKAAGVKLYFLLGVADGLISDYSSVAVDFLLCNRPIGFVISDYRQYAMERGFIFTDPLQYMPGHKIADFEDLKAFLKDREDTYAEERAKVFPIMQNPTDNYCQRLAKYLQL